MGRTVWVRAVRFMGATLLGVSIADLLSTGAISEEVRARATIVAVKGTVTWHPVHLAAALVTPGVHFGLAVGKSTLDNIDFVTPMADQRVAEGYMYMRSFFSTAWGTGALPVQAKDEVAEVDVRAKRKLGGVGIQTLWAVLSVLVAGDTASVDVALSILLYVL